MTIYQEILLFMIILTIGVVQGSAGSNQSCGQTDIHIHLIPDGQSPDGLSGPGPSGFSEERPNRPMQQKGPGQKPIGVPVYTGSAAVLISRMDKSNISAAIIMPPPHTNENLLAGELEGLNNSVSLYPKRLFLAGGGESLNPIIHATPRESVTNETRREFRARAVALARSGIVAFGEMAALHLSLSQRHPFEEVPPDHPLFLELADVAAEYQIPIDLHMEAVQNQMPMPAGFSANNPATLAPNIAGLERLLDHNPDARIIWEHIGWDNTGDMTRDLLETLLSRHTNLYLAIQIEERLEAMDGTPMKNRLVDESGTLLPEWRDLIQKYPNRFFFGTDTFIATVPLRIPESWDQTWSVRDQLPADLADQIDQNTRTLYRFAC
ncbi:MAG TPA: amidohydrolase family protein [Methanospirillum sp.]|nr:amidohydrolase family protein [Methanospirillum sp.]